MIPGRDNKIDNIRKRKNINNKGKTHTLIILFLGHKIFLCNSFDTLLNLGDLEVMILEEKKSTKEDILDLDLNLPKNIKNIIKITEIINKEDKEVEAKINSEDREVEVKINKKRQKIIEVYQMIEKMSHKSKIKNDKTQLSI